MLVGMTIGWTPRELADASAGPIIVNNWKLGAFSEKSLENMGFTHFFWELWFFGGDCGGISTDTFPLRRQRNVQWERYRARHVVKAEGCFFGVFFSSWKFCNVDARSFPCWHRRLKMEVGKTVLLFAVWVNRFCRFLARTGTYAYIDHLSHDQAASSHEQIPL